MLDKNDFKIAAPQVHLSSSTSRRMWLVSACALAPILQSAVGDGWASLLVAAVALASALTAELILDRLCGSSSLRDGSAVASAMILSLLMPNQINLFVPFVAAIFAVVVIKRSFGGLGANWLNPALGAWLFARLSWPSLFKTALSVSSFLLEAAVTKGLSDPSGSPLAVLKIAGYQPSAGDGFFADWLNHTIFSSLGAELPAGYAGLLLSEYPGIIADRGLLALLIATIVLLASKSTRNFIPAVFLISFALLVRLFGGLPYGASNANGDVLFSLFSGGTLAAAFLLASDPATGPKSNAFAVIFAILMGSLSFVFRYIGSESYGALLAIAALNALIPLARGLERKLFYQKRRTL
ncbi:RnfABCDGE type electron transport complex subunit D [Treponema sp.]